MGDGVGIEPTRPVPERWPVERVMAAAPDTASAVAGRKLARPGPWSGVGWDGPVLWAQCRGSARQAYQVVVDTAVPRYECSCPSRKFPCKHVLGLLFRWAEGRLGGESDGAGRTPGVADPDAENTTGQTDDKGHTAGGAGPLVDLDGAGSPVADAKAVAARARAQERDARVDAGLVELQRWLTDRLTFGLGRLAARPDALEVMAARMVDAQAPGVARSLRRLAAMSTGDDEWASRVLAEFGLLDLLARAFSRRAELPEDFLATVRTHLGFTVGKAEVLSTPAVADQWCVFGLHDTEDDERVSTRRVWLRGRETGRCAVVLLFAINGAPYEMTVAPGMELDADLHFYPGRPPLRALVGNRRFERPLALGLQVDPTQATLTAARDSWAAALAADPWLTVWPAVVRGRLVAGPVGDRVEFLLVGEAGGSIAVCGPDSVRWRALAVTGGVTVTWLGELRADGFNVLSFVDTVHTHAELVVL